MHQQKFIRVGNGKRDIGSESVGWEIEIEPESALLLLRFLLCIQGMLVSSHKQNR
jgi:hypothetical protein